MSKQVAVPYEFLEACAEINACASLSASITDKPTAKTIHWRNRMWVCVSSASRYLRYLEATVIQVVPADEYRGKPYVEVDHSRKAQTYTGLHFTAQGRQGGRFVMTANKITLVPIEERR